MSDKKIDLIVYKRAFSLDLISPWNVRWRLKDKAVRLNKDLSMASGNQLNRITEVCCLF